MRLRPELIFSSIKLNLHMFKNTNVSTVENDRQITSILSAM